MTKTLVLRFNFGGGVFYETSLDEHPVLPREGDQVAFQEKQPDRPAHTFGKLYRVTEVRHLVGQRTVIVGVAEMR